MASVILARVSGITVEGELNVRETVTADTPAAAATSAMVGTRPDTVCLGIPLDDWFMCVRSCGGEVRWSIVA